jgi:release factor glutamine methyltransferase
MPLTVGAALAWAQREIAAVDARVLLCSVLDRDAAYLIAHPEAQLDPGQETAFRDRTSRRVRGEPVAYLTGEREFYGLSLRVTPAVLIPRPETELLVEIALEKLPQDAAGDVLDLATGSGCVALAIAKERPRAHVTATDASEEALAVARGNAEQLGLGRVRFLQGDWFNALAGERFDVIVSNPPYVAAGDSHLAQGDLRFEPRQALVAGADGLDCIRHIVSAAPAHLAPGGWLLLEHGFDQGPACRKFLELAGFGEVSSRRDLAEHERVSGGRLTAMQHPS